MRIRLVNSVHWRDVDAGDFAFDFAAEPFAAVESTLIEQRLLVSVDGALCGTPKSSKGMQKNGP